MAARGSIQLGLLGPLAAWRDGAALPLGGGKQRATLAVLALGRGRTVTTDALIEALWAGQAPGRPQTAFEGYVCSCGRCSARRRSRPRRAGTGSTFRRTRSTAPSSSAGSPPRARLRRRTAAELAAALALWRGPALAEFTYETWAQPEIARLDELRLAAFEARLDADLECGRAPSSSASWRHSSANIRSVSACAGS